MNLFPEKTSPGINGEPIKAAILLVLILVLSPGRLFSLSFDARRIAMGGALLPYHSESSILNPAYLDIEEKAPHTIPIPIGLFAFLADLPSFDPNDPSFDAVELANLLLNPPFYLELRNEKKADSTNIFIDISNNSLMVDLDNLQQFTPIGPVETGLFDIRQPRIGLTLKDIHLSVSPFILMEGSLELSKNLENVLAEAQPMAPNTDYSVTSSGRINSGLSINAGHVFNITDLLSMQEGPQFSMGINVKYIMGFAYADLNNSSNIHTYDPIFDSDNPPQLTSTTTMDYAIPESGDIGPKGSGYGIDVGFLARFNSLDIGLGIQDAYTKIHWRASRDLLVYEDSTNDLQRTTIFEDRGLSVTAPRTFSLSLAYRSMEETGWGENPQVGDYILAYNAEVASGDLIMRVGGETYYGPGPIALRFGAFNQGGKAQFSLGVGIPLKIFNFDIALTTHDRSYDQHRGLTLATSISFP